jgi:hypothetical protein
VKRKCLLLAIAVLCAGRPAAWGKVINILFVGNSYIYVNDLPAVFAKLAASGKHEVNAATAAEAGFTLSKHLSSGRAAGIIEGQKWDYIILQEQSVVPAIQDSRLNEMYPAVRAFTDKIRAMNGVPVLFMTWGRRDGMTGIGSGDYKSMQNQLRDGYMGIAGELGIAVAPVGMAWENLLDKDNSIRLWQEDGSHPTNEGTYLAACTFYAALFRQSPEGLAFHAGISEETAKLIQITAGETVLRDPAAWNLSASKVEK